MSCRGHGLMRAGGTLTWPLTFFTPDTCAWDTVVVGGMEVGVTEVFFLFLQPRGKSFTAWAASHFAFKHARPGEPLRHPVTGAGRRPDGIWVCSPMTSAGEAAGAASSPRSQVAARSGSPLAQKRSSLCASAAYSHRCAARRAGPYLRRGGGCMVSVLPPWLHQGAMVAPSPWRCRCPTGAFSRSACG